MMFNPETRFVHNILYLCFYNKTIAIFLIFYPRTVNGENADTNKYPWQMFLQVSSESKQRYSRHIRGVVVLDEGRILTTAHCVHHEYVTNSHSVYTLWLSCLYPLVILFIPLGYPVYTFGYPV
jgi:hypothetical protein